tara:strand:+ start:9562 stop:10554 length:993 start_codon:yes stop_codon:yes gene_type:complete
MDSYGIHAAQLQGNAETASNHDYINQVRQHNQKVVSDYQSAVSGAQTKGEESDAKGGAESTYAAMRGVHSALQSYNTIRQYGGVKGALTTGVSQNIYDLTGGKAGSVPMGKYEARARDATTDNPSYEPMRNPQGSAEAQISAGQERDVAGGWTRAANPANKTTAEIQAGAKMGENNEGLGFEGKVAKKLATTAGIDEGIAHGIGAASSVATGLGSMAYGAYNIAENWKSDNTAQKTGAVLGEIGGAIDLAGAAAPVLAPIGLAFDAASAISDLIGGVQKESSSLKTASDAKSSDMLSAPKQRDNNVQSSTTTQTAPTSLQKLSGGSSSSY